MAPNDLHPALVPPEILTRSREVLPQLADCLLEIRGSLHLVQQQEHEDR